MECPYLTINNIFNFSSFFQLFGMMLTMVHPGYTLAKLNAGPHHQQLQSRATNLRVCVNFGYTLASFWVTYRISKPGRDLSNGRPTPSSFKNWSQTLSRWETANQLSLNTTDLPSSRKLKRMFSSPFSIGYFFIRHYIFDT